MKRNSTSRKSMTKLSKVRKTIDADIARDADAPPWTPEMFARAVARRGLKPLSSRKSNTSSRRLRSLSDKGVRVTPEHPEADLRHIAKGIVRRGLKVAGPKELVSLRIDADVLNWFRSSGVGYQTRINAVLRAYMDAAAG